MIESSYIDTISGELLYFKTGYRNYQEYFKDEYYNIHHRVDGPAITDADGNQWWLQNGIYHRLDGPAAEFVEGQKEWFINNQLHREDGPAIITADGDEFWYINGSQINCNSQKEFEKYLKLKGFW